ncbi:hypothetical protein [Inhella sp.]|uniref:hypothetical protein n=1 Tax=Inhella sp. TaxID=1921806 RepID=UPI0035B2FCFA
MHFKVPDAPIAIAMLLAWVLIVCMVVVVYRAMRWWRKRHPPAKPKLPKSYAGSLRERLGARRAGPRRTKAKSRSKKPPHRS